MHNLHNEEIYIVFFASLSIGEGGIWKEKRFAGTEREI